MAQSQAWEKEYQNPLLITRKAEPQTDTKDFLKFLRRKEAVDLSSLKVLDLGSGTGRNANYLAELGSDVLGLELSPSAVAIAKERARDLEIKAQYKVANFGAPLGLADASIDLILDVMSSNSLTEAERTIYLAETARVLKVGGHFFVRTLAKDGDKNAKQLLKLSPGKERDTYINKAMNLTERVFAREDFIALYSPSFEIQRLELKTNYARFGGQSYKRNYWLAYLKKA